jgi:hypothetical protein
MSPLPCLIIFHQYIIISLIQESSQRSAFNEALDQLQAENVPG